MERGAREQTRERPDQRTQALPRAHVAPVNMLPVVVVGRREVAREVICLWLAQPNAERAPAAYLPGQFTTLALPTTRETLYRSYSLSGDGRADRPWEITVKRQHAGVVSSFLYDHAADGMELYASPPRGSFTLPRPIVPGMPLVFVAAGSGIAPVYGMVRALALLPPRVRPQVQLHYASNAPEDVIYSRELAALDPEQRWLSQWHYLSSRNVRMEPELVLVRTGEQTTASHWYVCGPEALKRTMQAVLARQGTPPEQVHVEVFGGRGVQPGLFTQPLPGLPPRQAHEGSLWLADRGQVVTVQPGETILEALERSGYQPAFSCRAGVCGDCRLRVLAGEVRTQTHGGLSAAERAAGYVLSCVAHPVGTVTLASVDGNAPVSGTPGPAARQSNGGAVSAVRAGAAAAAVALFAGALGLTHSNPYVQQATSTPNFTVPAPTHTAGKGGSKTGNSTPGANGANGDNGTSGITVNPSTTFPNATSSIS